MLMLAFSCVCEQHHGHDDDDDDGDGGRETQTGSEARPPTLSRCDSQKRSRVSVKTTSAGVSVTPLTVRAHTRTHTTLNVTDIKHTYDFNVII